MGVFQLFQLLLTHPLEFATLAQFYLFRNPTRDITNPDEFGVTGYDRESMRKCWYFLDKTSRTFSTVIKELDGELARVICIFYLVLRGLDTIEDDMTLSDEIKQPMLRTFHQKLIEKGWSFDGSGPAEKDRQLLVEFDNVVTEVRLLDPLYREVITDITIKMETGMADFAHRAAITKTGPYLNTITEYHLYCHYVAGLVGEGLSRLWAATGKEQPRIADELVLSNSMGLLLQKTNIIRDFREDCDERRYFWPKEIWERYGFEAQEDMSKRGIEEMALWALSEIILDAMSNCVDALDYLVLLRNQTIFNFCAIPATMAIATLELCFMNPAVFQRNIKIRRAEAVQLIMNSTTLRDVAHIFRSYSRKIHQKASPADPNYLGICAMWKKIDAWVEQHCPSSSPSLNTLGSVKQEYSAGDRYHDLRLEAQGARGGEIADLTDVKELWMERVESRTIRWQWWWFTFVGGMTLFLFGIAGVSVLGMLYFMYGERWGWEDISAVSLGGAAGRFALIR